MSDELTRLRAIVKAAGALAKAAFAVSTFNLAEDTSGLTDLRRALRAFGAAQKGGGE